MLKLYNTMSRSKEKFQSLEPNKVKIFACGPSIYQRPHIGNYRTFLYEDLLIRYLEYSGYKVKHTIILTDIEDKSITEAKIQNKRVGDLTGGIAERFFRESELLNIKLPKPVPRSSTSIKQTVYIIKELLASGHAYRYKGDIFFDPLKFKGFGKLFGLDMNRWPRKKIRFKRDTYNGRRWNLGDFILWHGYRDGDIAFWDTEIGRGRPSWNIQDPAIVTEHLGYRIDINCGGIDNIYRHHDYNIAIIESISGKDYANYYMHGEHLIVNGRSMSKSRGNILYPEDMIKNKLNPCHLRFFLLYTHYRKKLNLTDKRFRDTCRYIDSARSIINELLKQDSLGGKTHSETASQIDSIKYRFENNMNNDLGFGTAVDDLFLGLKKLKLLKDQGKYNSQDTGRLDKILKKIDTFAGVFFK